MYCNINDASMENKNYWFVGRVSIEGGYNVFVFSANLNILPYLLSFTLCTDRCSIWSDSDYYGTVDLYLKECFDTREQAEGFGKDFASSKKLDSLEWNSFYDPWEDR